MILIHVFFLIYRILCSRSFSQLNATFAAYNQIAKKDIEKSIKDEMSGDLEFACLTIGNHYKIHYEE